MSFIAALDNNTWRVSEFLTLFSVFFFKTNLKWKHKKIGVPEETSRKYLVRVSPD